MNQKEVWKDIEKYKGNYQVSNLGRVKSLKYGKSRILKLEEVKGYLRVSLCCNNKINRFQVHRLVSYHFIPNNENKPCVNHKDGDKSNNNVNNLEWCSYSENELHSYTKLGKINHNRKLNKYAILDIRKNAVKGVFPFNKIRGNINLFINKYNVDRKTVLNVLNNKYYV